MSWPEKLSSLAHACGFHVYIYIIHVWLYQSIIFLPTSYSCCVHKTCTTPTILGLTIVQSGALHTHMYICIFVELAKSISNTSGRGNGDSKQKTCVCPTHHVLFYFLVTFTHLNYCRKTMRRNDNNDKYETFFLDTYIIFKKNHNIFISHLGPNKNIMRFRSTHFSQWVNANAYTMVTKICLHKIHHSRNEMRVWQARPTIRKSSTACVLTNHACFLVFFFSEFRF